MSRSAVRSIVLLVLSAVVVVYAAACLLAFLLQDRLVFFPGPPSAIDPARLGLTFEEIELSTSDGARLHAWHLPGSDTTGVVLVCHGNAGTIADRLPLAQTFLAMGRSVFLFDYRGYGRSQGRPSEAGTYADAEAAYFHLVSRGLDPRRGLAVYGESLGAGVAVELARRHRVAAVILESAFTSIPDVGARAYPFLPVRWLSRIRYDNRAKIGALKAPLLIAHSPDDEIVPFAQGEELFAAALEPKTLLRTRGRHNDGGFTAQPAACAEVERFLDRTLGSPNR